MRFWDKIGTIEILNNRIMKINIENTEANSPVLTLEILLIDKSLILFWINRKEVRTAPPIIKKEIWLDDSEKNGENSDKSGNKR